MTRRPFALLATLALTAAGAVAVAPPAAAEDDGGATYVALGDSFAAGTGVPPYVDGGACLRSASGYPSLLTRWPAFRGLDDVTCAGAVTADVAAQFAAADIGPDTRRVTVTVGGNDVGWSQTLMGCMAAPEGCSAAFLALANRIPAVTPAVRAVVQAVAAQAPNADILVTGYPYLFGDFRTSCTVGTSPTGAPIVVDRATATAVNSAVLGLNAAIAHGVATSGEGDATYVNVAAFSLTHGLCRSGTDWINGVQYAGLQVLPLSLHPNLAGEQAYANRVLLASWLN